MPVQPALLDLIYQWYGGTPDINSAEYQALLAAYAAGVNAYDLIGAFANLAGASSGDVLTADGLGASSFLPNSGGGGGAVWGTITGTLSAQTDLLTALNARQGLNAHLTAIAGLTATTDNFLIAVASEWASRTPAQAKVTLALNNVDNTSDVNKPVSTAQQTAIDQKAFNENPTAIKTANYNAGANDYVPVDSTAGNITVTLPTAPADKTRIGVKHVIQGGTNTVTVACGGSDVFNRAGGGTTLTLTLSAQGTMLQYKASGAIWYVQASDFALPQLDTRYGFPATDISTLGAAAQLTGAEIIPGYQGAATVGILSKQLISSPWDVRLGFNGTYHRFYEEFENAAAVTTAGPMVGTYLQVALAGASSGSVAQQWGTEVVSGYIVVGVGGLTTGTSTTGHADFEYLISYAWNQADLITYMTRVRIPTLSDGTNTFIVRAGFSSSMATAPVNGIYFEAQSGVTNWQAINRAASTSTTTDTGIPVSATKYTNLAIVTDGTTVHFYASNDQTHMGEVATQSTNRPANATALVPSLNIIKSAGSTARTVNCDVLSWTVPFDRGLTVRV